MHSHTRPPNCQVSHWGGVSLLSYSSSKFDLLAPLPGNLGLAAVVQEEGGKGADRAITGQCLPGTKSSGQAACVKEQCSESTHQFEQMLMKTSEHSKPSGAPPESTSKTKPANPVRVLALREHTPPKGRGRNPLSGLTAQLPISRSSTDCPLCDTHSSLLSGPHTPSLELPVPSQGPGCSPKDKPG